MGTRAGPLWCRSNWGARRKGRFSYVALRGGWGIWQKNALDKRVIVVGKGAAVACAGNRHSLNLLL